MKIPSITDETPSITDETPSVTGKMMFIPQHRGTKTGTKKMWKQVDNNIKRLYNKCKGKSNEEKCQIIKSVILRLQNTKTIDRILQKDEMNLPDVLYVWIKSELISLVYEYFTNLLATGDYKNLEVWKSKCFDDYITEKESAYFITE